MRQVLGTWDVALALVAAQVSATFLVRSHISTLTRWAGCPSGRVQVQRASSSRREAQLLSTLHAHFSFLLPRNRTKQNPGRLRHS